MNNKLSYIQYFNKNVMKIFVNHIRRFAELTLKSDFHLFINDLKNLNYYGNDQQKYYHVHSI